ncbi:MAG: peptidylprolyl isomerase [Bradyrhizobium sp.]|jgi:peptidylprolyl isomerase|uniref:FKBP-type peptidyl-prolyl cis-trans isomerase n=1 Tax=Bradyrhizobium sp. TaxID=376 RepID=UPI0039E70BE4
MLYRLPLLCLTLLFFSTTIGAETTNVETSETIQNESDANIDKELLLKLSETIGHMMGQGLNTPEFEFDLEQFIIGIRSAVAGKPAPMNEHDFQQVWAEIERSAFERLAENNLSEANDFMRGNILSGEVVELEPGKLQYRISHQGSLEEVKEKSTPLIHYTGRFLDGSVFGSSVETDTPLALALENTILGFSKGIVGMKEGEIRTLFIHPDLGYGASSQQKMPPNALLIFEVEVLQANALVDAAPVQGVE